MTELILVENVIDQQNQLYIPNTLTEEEEEEEEEEGVNAVVDNGKIMVKVQCCRCRPDWFVKDGLGITCSGMTYGLIFFAEFVVIGVILLPGFPFSVWSYFHSFIFTGFAFLAASSHLRAMTTNPGTIPRGNFTDENVKGLGLKAGDVVVRCTRCECIKTDRAHHCSTCQRCIRKMDHHCPWINNCVGECNQKYFMLFTFYIMTISGYAMALAIHYLIKCSEQDWKDCTFYSPATTIIFIVFLIFEGLLFGLFTMIMFCTQVNSVIQDETGIEHLKNEVKEKKGGNWRDRLQDTFGGNFSIVWFSPFSSTSNTRKRLEYSYYDV